MAIFTQTPKVEKTQVVYELEDNDPNKIAAKKTLRVIFDNYNAEQATVCIDTKLGELGIHSYFLVRVNDLKAMIQEGQDEYKKTLEANKLKATYGLENASVAGS